MDPQNAILELSIGYTVPMNSEVNLGRGPGESMDLETTGHSDWPIGGDQLL
jgi:hypothetical protein